MASRDIKDLHPTMQVYCRRFIDKCKERGIDLIITCTYRSAAEQDALYTQGRTTAGRIVTNARGGQSKHNNMVGGYPASLAFDVVPLRGGKPVWGTKGDDLALWQSIGQIGRMNGLEWAGDWKRFKEFPHFQLKESI